MISISKIIIKTSTYKIKDLLLISFYCCYLLVWGLKVFFSLLIDFFQQYFIWCLFLHSIELLLLFTDFFYYFYLSLVPLYSWFHFNRQNSQSLRIISFRQALKFLNMTLTNLVLSYIWFEMVHNSPTMIDKTNEQYLYKLAY